MMKQKRKTEYTEDMNNFMDFLQYFEKIESKLNCSDWYCILLNMETN